MHDGSARPPLIAGKYRLVERLGQGGMGAVWRAEHAQLRTAVAVKLMSPKMLESRTFRARFEREARAAAQLKTKHVVTVHDYGVEGDAPYIVMELLDGEDLSSRLRRERRMSPVRAASVVSQIARALDRAHAAGLVHRDLKPANIFLARLDDEEVVKVLDFGIAKDTSTPGADGLTGDDEVLGTPTYMSPEQIRSLGAVDQRTDLWSLGVIAYRLLTGSLPFAGDTGGDLVVRVCTEPAAPPSSRDPSLGPAVDRFFERALAKDPAHRFSSAREMSASFEAALGVSGAAGRGSYADIPSAPLSSPSLPAIPPEQETALALFRAPRPAPPLDNTGHRRRGVALALGAVGLLAGLAGVVVLVVISAGGRAAEPRAAAAAPVEAASSPAISTATATAAPTHEPTADASAASAPTATPTAPPTPSAWPGSRSKSKRRKVEIGL